MTLKTLVFRYTLFAVIATIANLGLQRLVFLAGDTAPVFMAAVFAGTLVGLVVKYILDKRWIFADMGQGLRAHSKKFSLYTTMGVITTAIFWGTEATFWYVWKTDAMRELGAVLGLAVGYVIKYQLDRRYVFDTAPLAPGGAQGGQG